MKMIKPVFSVIIPLYNKEKYILKCINSVLEQSFSATEIVVVDDGSTDNSAEIVNLISDPRVKLYKQLNAGVSAARNKGIELAKGAYIAFLDADDWYEKSYLSKAFSHIESFPDHDLYATGYLKHKNDQINTSYMPISDSGLIKNFYDYWAEGAFFFTSSSIIDSKYFIKHDKYFPVGESMGEDQELWFHLAENGKIYFIAECLVNYNMNTDNSLSFNSKLTDELPFIVRLKSRVNLNEKKSETKGERKFISKYELELSINNALYGNKITASKLLLNNFFCSFNSLKALAFFLILSPRWMIYYARRIKSNV